MYLMYFTDFYGQGVFDGLRNAPKFRAYKRDLILRSYGGFNAT
jgi:hypothetical protein